MLTHKALGDFDLYKNFQVDSEKPITQEFLFKGFSSNASKVQESEITILARGLELWAHSVLFYLYLQYFLLTFQVRPIWN